MSFIKSQFKKIFTVLVVSFLSISAPVNALEIGQQAPDFTLKNLQGKNVNLAEQRGQIILLNF